MNHEHFAPPAQEGTAAGRIKHILSQVGRYRLTPRSDDQLAASIYEMSSSSSVLS
jgi:hypothetical protein